jgi:hypothetical protein
MAMPRLRASVSEAPVNLVTLLGVASMLAVAWFTWRTYSAADSGTGPQSKRASLIEAWTNIVIGFSINYAANLVLLPLVGAQLTMSNNFWLGWIYTLVSVVRQYAIRRSFNARSFAERLAGKLG